MAARVSDRGAIASYAATSRAPRYSLLFALPLFLLYEGLAATQASSEGVTSLRNAADVVLKTPFLLLSGTRGSLAFFATVIGVFVFLVARDMTKSKARLEPRTFALMFGESAVLALLLGIVVGTLTQRLLGGLSLLLAQSGGGASPIESLPWSARMMLALGAGLYEELLFRVLLVGGIAAALTWLLGKRTTAVGVTAACAGALIFSAFHYIGTYADEFQLASFVYRAIAGLVFSGLYLTRGFGITAWTHALYDVYVLL